MVPHPQTATPAFFVRPLTAALLAAFAAPTLAQDATMSEVVVSAAGFEQKITDAPASISVITAEELSKKPYTSLTDAVSQLEGVDIGETSDKTGQRSISMRGMGSDYTLILIDGKRQNNHGDIYPNGFGGNQFNHIPPLDAIERIEVIRGPAGTLYGADAMGGVINIITKKDAKEWSGSMTVGRTFQSDSDYGDSSTADFSVRGPILPGTLSMSLRGSIYDRDASNPSYKARPAGNELRTPSLGFGGGGRTVDNTNKAYGVSLYFTPDDRQRITFDFDSSNQEYDNSPIFDENGDLMASLGTVDSIDGIWRADDNGMVQPRVGYLDEQKFTRDSWSLSHEGEWDFGTSFVALSYIETDNKGRTQPFTVAERQHLQDIYDGVGDFSGMSEDERRDAAQAAFLPRPTRTLQSNQYTLDAKLDIPIMDFGGDHLFVVGGQYIDGELKDSVFGMEDGSPGEAQEHKMWSVFAEDNWMPTDNFTLTAGLRYDNHDTFGSHVSPRIYGVYSLSPQWTLKGGVSTGYKTPKTTDLYDGVVGFTGQGATPTFGNPDLEPETSRSSEIALYWDHPARHNFNITLFHNDFKDKISSQDCGPGTAQSCSSTGDYADLGYANSSKNVNIDKAVIQGIELAGRWQIADRWALRGNYTYTDSEQKSGEEKGLPLTHTAKHMFNTTLDWQARSDLLVFLTMEARSKRYRGQINDQAEYYKGYEVFHLGASYQVNDNFTINGRINNLLDEDFTSYRWVPCSPGRGCDDGFQFREDYNNEHKARSVWVSANYRF